MDTVARDCLIFGGDIWPIGAFDTPPFPTARVLPFTGFGHQHFIDANRA
jgi:hypothetical protein